MIKTGYKTVEESLGAKFINNNALDEAAGSDDNQLDPQIAQNLESINPAKAKKAVFIEKIAPALSSLFSEAPKSTEFTAFGSKSLFFYNYRDSIDKLTSEIKRRLPSAKEMSENSFKLGQVVISVSESHLFKDAQEGTSSIEINFVKNA